MVFETRVAICQSQHFSSGPLKFHVEPFFHMFVVQRLHNLQQGARVLYCSPLLQVNGSACAKNWQSLVMLGRQSLNTETVSYEIIGAWNFSHKDQGVFDHRDCKQQFTYTRHMLGVNMFFLNLFYKQESSMFLYYEHQHT